MATSKQTNSFEQAKKFIRKYCRLLGNGVSFSSKDGSFHSWLKLKISVMLRI